MSSTTVLVVCAVAPSGVVEVMTIVLVPVASVTACENEPSGPATVVAFVVALPWSVATSTMSMVAPGAALPVTVTVPVAADWSAGAVTVRVVPRCWWVTYRATVWVGVSTLRRALRSATSRTNEPAPQVSGAADPAGFPLTNPIEATVGSVPKGEDATVAASQSCSGTRPTPDDPAIIALRRAPAAGACPVERYCWARSPLSTGQMCPVPWFDGAQGAPSVGQPLAVT